VADLRFNNARHPGSAHQYARCRSPRPPAAPSPRPAAWTGRRSPCRSSRSTCRTLIPSGWQGDHQDQHSLGPAPAWPEARAGPAGRYWECAVTARHPSCGVWRTLSRTPAVTAHAAVHGAGPGVSGDAAGPVACFDESPPGGGVAWLRMPVLAPLLVTQRLPGLMWDRRAARLPERGGQDQLT
jgi:hypothetical protein